MRLRRQGSQLRVEMDTNNDGRMDTVLDPADPEPKRGLLRRWVMRAVGWVPTDRVVRYVVRWLALKANKHQLTAAITLCSGALALAELREEIELACEDGCPIEVQERSTLVPCPFCCPHPFPPSVPQPQPQPPVLLLPLSLPLCLRLP